MSSNVVQLKQSYTKDEIVSGLELNNANTAKRAPVSVTPIRKGVASALPPEMDTVCGDGERTRHLTRLAGILINQGRPLDEVIALASAWNAKNNPPLDDEKVEATCTGIWNTDQRKHADENTAGTDSAELALFDIDEARVSQFLATEPPPRRWILKDCLQYGNVGAIVAPGGTGKSQLLLQLGVSIAAGLPFLGFWEVPEPGGVLMLLAEDDEQEIHRRLHNIHEMVCAQYPNDKDLTKRLESNLYVRSMVGEHNLMTAAGVNGEVQSTGYAQRAVATAQGIQNLKLIVVDPASRFRGGIENSAEDVTRFIEELEYMKKQTRATVLVAHHANKGSMNATEASQNAARGSSAFSDGVRWQMNLAMLSKDDAKKLNIVEERRHFYLTASMVKNNYAAPIDTIYLQRKEQGYLEKVDLGILEQVSEIALLYKVKEVLRFDEKSDKQHTRTSFEKEYGGADKYLRIAFLPLRENLSRWVADGKLFEVNKKLKADAPMPSRCSVPSGRKSYKLNS